MVRIAGVAEASGSDAVISIVRSPVGCRQLSESQRCCGIALTAARANANRKPTKTITIRPDLLPRRGSCGGGTSCPTKRTAGFDQIADTLVLPPSCLGTCFASSLSVASETCASQAACTRTSGSSGSVGALILWRLSADVGPFVLTGVSFSALLALALRNEASR